MRKCIPPYSEEIHRVSYAGRKRCEAKELAGGYCGSCGYDVHVEQLNNTNSWVHSSLDKWLEEMGRTDLVQEASTPPRFRDSFQTHVKEQNEAMNPGPDPDKLSIRRDELILQLNQMTATSTGIERLADWIISVERRLGSVTGRRAAIEHTKERVGGTNN